MFFAVSQLRIKLALPASAFNPCGISMVGAGIRFSMLFKNSTFEISARLLFFLVPSITIVTFLTATWPLKSTTKTPFSHTAWGAAALALAVCSPDISIHIVLPSSNSTSMPPAVSRLSVFPAIDIPPITTAVFPSDTGKSILTGFSFERFPWAGFNTIPFPSPVKSDSRFPSTWTLLSSTWMVTADGETLSSILACLSLSSLEFTAKYCKSTMSTFPSLFKSRLSAAVLSSIPWIIASASSSVSFPFPSASPTRRTPGCTSPLYA